jgi:hypothetical protein
MIRLAVTSAICLGCLVADARAEPEPPRPPSNRPYAVAMFHLPLVTYVGASGAMESKTFTPDERFATSQMVGFGVVRNARWRMALMGVFGEMLSGRPPGAPAWQLGAVAPIVTATFGRFQIGAGPIFAYRTGGTNQLDLGAIVIPALAFPIEPGLSFNVALPMPIISSRRIAALPGVAVGLGLVF